MNCEVFELYNGYEIPTLFYGTYNVVDEVVFCLDVALGTGYRAIDTASFYHNERRIGSALKMLMPKHSISRKELYISSKLPPKLYGGTATIKACQLSLSALETGYIDLYLVHWPDIHKSPSTLTIRDGQGYIRDIRRQSWMALESMVISDPTSIQELMEGSCASETTILGSGSYRVLRSIGVCNYLPRHVEELSGYCTIPPAVIQYECHPLLGAETQEYSLRRLCTRLFPLKPIHFQAHSALAGGSDALLNNEVILQIASNLRRTAAQVAIRWCLQKGNSVVVKSQRPRHIVENARVYGWSLDQASMDRIDSLANNTRLCWDPATLP